MRNYGLSSRLLISERKPAQRTDCIMETGKGTFDELAHIVSGFATGLIHDSFLHTELV